MKKTHGIAVSTIAFAIFLGFAAGLRVQAEENPAWDLHWKSAAKVNLEEVAEKTAEAAIADSVYVRQPTILALRTAYFLSFGSFDVPHLSMRETIRTQFEGPHEEVFDKATVTVELMGFADDSLFGERFSFKLQSDEKGTWTVVEAERAAYGRGDHQ